MMVMLMHPFIYALNILCSFSAVAAVKPGSVPGLAIYALLAQHRAIELPHVWLHMFVCVSLHVCLRQR